MHDLYKQENLPYLNVKVCPNCTGLVPLNDEVCPSCTYNFKSKKTNRTTRVEKIQPKVEEVVESNNNNDDDNDEVIDNSNITNDTIGRIIYCDKCGARIIGTQNYCGGCGAKVTKKICPSCNNIVDVDLAFCTYCGAKLKESDGVVEMAKEDVDSQIITSNISSEETNNVDNNDDIVDEKTVTLSVENDMTSPSIPPVSINMTRKRIFSIIQIIVSLLLLAIIIFVPIMTKESFFAAIGACFTSSSNETLMSGKDLIQIIIDFIKTQSIDTAKVQELLVNPNGKLLFSDISIVHKILGAFEFESIFLYASLCVVALAYLSIFVGLLILIITSIFGIIKKTPLKGNCLGALCIIFTIWCVFIYSNTFSKNFEKYDSWLIYGFVITFFLWFAIKLILGKEARQYKAYKKSQKLLHKFGKTSK